MRLSLLAFALLAASSASAQGTGTLAGQVLEVDGVTAVIGVNVRVDGTAHGSATDLNGNYRIIGVPVGTYTVTASYSGSEPQSVQGVEVQAGTTRPLSFTIVSEPVSYQPLYELYPPLITNDAIGQSRILTGQDLENMPVNR